MADHPLRPAIHRWLGGPLPHQLPNAPQAPLSAINLSSSGQDHQIVCSINPSFLGLSSTERQVTYVLLTRSPLSPKTSFDLHVLSPPLAFALSQDQTLQLKNLIYFDLTHDNTNFIVNFLSDKSLFNERELTI